MKELEHAQTKSLKVDPYAKSSPKKDHLDRALVTMIAQDLQPISMVQDKGFRNFCLAMDPRYQIPSRQSITTSLIPMLFKETEHHVQMQLNSVNWLSITTDLWTSINSSSFMAVTAHFWDKKTSSLSTLVLDCARFHGRHTSEMLANELTKVLTAKNILPKVVACVTDNAANIVKATRMANVKHLPCFAHSLNLVATASLSSNARLLQLKSHVSGIVELTKRSGHAAELLEAVQKKLGNTRPKKLIQDVQTRWNSTFEMFERIQELKDPVTLFLNDSTISSKLENISRDSWKILNDAVEVLNPLYEATVELSGDRKPTGSKVVPIVTLLMGHYESIKIDEASSTFKHELELAHVVLEQLNKRFSLIEKIPELAVGTLLDPRFKGRCFRSATDKISAITLLRSETESIHMSSKAISSQSSISLGKVDPSPVKKKRRSLWDAFDTGATNQIDQDNTTAFEAAAIIVSSFLELPCQPRTTDPFHWWSKEGAEKFPLLKELAIKYLSVPATSVPSERVFSSAGLVLTKKRNRLGDTLAQQLICLHGNLKGE